MVSRHVLSKTVGKYHCPLSITALFRPRSTGFWLVRVFRVLYEKKKKILVSFVTQLFQPRTRLKSVVSTR